MSKEERETVLALTVKNLLWTLSGILIGLSANLVNSYLVESTKLNYASLLLQLLLTSAVLAIIHQSVKRFGWTWQNTTPGLFFISFYFGVQFSVFQSIQKLFVEQE